MGSKSKADNPHTGDGASPGFVSLSLFFFFSPSVDSVSFLFDFVKSCEILDFFVLFLSEIGRNLVIFSNFFLFWNLQEDFHRWIA